MKYSLDTYYIQSQIRLGIAEISSMWRFLETLFIQSSSNTHVSETLEEKIMIQIYQITPATIHYPIHKNPQKEKPISQTPKLNKKMYQNHTYYMARLCSTRENQINGLSEMLFLEEKTENLVHCEKKMAAINVEKKFIG